MVVRVVYGGGLENRWVNSPGGSNPSPSEGAINFFIGEMPERPKGTVC